MSDKITLPDGRTILLSTSDKLLLTKEPKDMTRREKVKYLRLLLLIKGKSN